MLSLQSERGQKGQKRSVLSLQSSLMLYLTQFPVHAATGPTANGPEGGMSSRPRQFRRGLLDKSLCRFCMRFSALLGTTSSIVGAIRYYTSSIAVVVLIVEEEEVVVVVQRHARTPSRTDGAPVDVGDGFTNVKSASAS